MAVMTQCEREDVVATFCARYHLDPNGFQLAIHSYLDYACAGIAAGALLYTDQQLRTLEGEIFIRLHVLLQDADQSIAAIQFLEDSAYHLCRQRKAVCHLH